MPWGWTYTPQFQLIPETVVLLYSLVPWSQIDLCSRVNKSPGEGWEWASFTGQLWEMNENSCNALTKCCLACSKHSIKVQLLNKHKEITVLISSEAGYETLGVHALFWSLNDWRDKLGNQASYLASQEFNFLSGRRSRKSKYSYCIGFLSELNKRMHLINCSDYPPFRV